MYLITVRLVTLICSLLLISAVSFSHAGEMLASKAQVHNFDHGYESLLISALDKIRHGDTHSALSLLEQLVRVNPKFKLAQLMYADLLLARSRP